MKEPFKCTGKFKDDFDNICTSKNLKYVPEIISRSKRPGSAFQNSFIQHSETSGATTALMNKNDKKTNSTVNAKQKTTVTTATVEIENDIDQNPGIFNFSFYLFQNIYLKLTFF